MRTKESENRWRTSVIRARSRLVCLFIPGLGSYHAAIAARNGCIISISIHYTYKMNVYTIMLSTHVQMVWPVRIRTTKRSRATRTPAESENLSATILRRPYILRRREIKMCYERTEKSFEIIVFQEVSPRITSAQMEHNVINTHAYKSPVLYWMSLVYPQIVKSCVQGWSHARLVTYVICRRSDPSRIVRGGPRAKSISEVHVMNIFRTENEVGIITVLKIIYKAEWFQTEKGLLMFTSILV